MKDSYNKEIQLRCITCGDTDFDFNEDKTWIKCNRCKREYLGGYDELVELNQENINTEMKETQNEIKKAFKGNKNIKFK